MKIFPLIFAVLIIALSSCSSKREVEELTNPKLVKAMSFNIRNGLAKDGENHWDKRKHMVFHIINEYKPDICGMQEVYDFQLKEILKACSDYESIGEGRNGGTKGEYSNILYNSKYLKALDSGTFWLSDTPEKVSKSFGNNIYRICSWALFLNKKTEKHFYVFNTHFDHRSVPSRVQSARLVIEKIKNRKFKNYPFILTGDFNALPDSLEMNYFSSNNIVDSDDYIAHKDLNRGTFNGFVFGKYKRKIDYIFIKEKHWKVEGAEIIRYSENKKYPSDHFPVYTELILKEKSE